MVIKMEWAAGAVAVVVPLAVPKRPRSYPDLVSSLKWVTEQLQVGVAEDWLSITATATLLLQEEPVLETARVAVAGGVVDARAPKAIELDMEEIAADAAAAWRATTWSA
jgi:hypothetical protein